MDGMRNNWFLFSKDHGGRDKDEAPLMTCNPSLNHFDQGKESYFSNCKRFIIDGDG